MFFNLLIESEVYINSTLIIICTLRLKPADGIKTLNMHVYKVLLPTQCHIHWFYIQNESHFTCSYTVCCKQN
jgi:hypothetical protein